MDSMDQRWEAHEALKTALRRKGLSLRQTAKIIGVTCTAVSMVGQRKLQSDRIEQALADILAVPREDLFPDIRGQELLGHPST